MEKFKNILEQKEFSESEINNIFAHAHLKKTKIKEVVFDGTKSAQSIFFILSGAFVLKYWDEVLGCYRTVNFFLDSFTPFMGDINSYFTNRRNNCHLISIKKSKILAFSKQDIAYLSQSHEKFRELVNNQIIEALVVENNFRIQLITKTKPNFYNYLLSNYPEIIQEVPSKYIAEFMGISAEWLSKLKMKAPIS